MKRYLYWLIVGLLCLGALAHAQEQKDEDYVQAVTADLRQKTGKTPQPQEIVEALNRVVVAIYQKGDYRTAVTIAEQTDRFAEQRLAPEHLATLSSVNNLAELYRVQGRYGEAEPLYQQALAGYEEVLGPEHPNTLTSVNNLALLYDSQGRYGEAEPLYRRALAGREKVLGPEHPDTLTSVNNLAALYDSQGRYGEAEPLYRRALAASEKVLGPEHSDTLRSVNNLAELYRVQGRYGEAEPLYRRALAASEKVLGPEHPNTLTSVNNLAILYITQGRYGEAEPLLRRALAGREKVLGPEHLATMRSIHNLAFLYYFQGRYGEAEPLYRRALAASEKVLGPEHPNTLTSVNNLAVLYITQGRYGEAEPLYRRALAGDEKVLGPEHLDTLRSVNNLAELYYFQGRYGEAEPLYRRALAASEKVLGPEHPNTLTSVNNLAVLYITQGRYGEAEPLYRRALAGREKVLGPEHPETLLSVNNLAALYDSQGRYGEAESLYRRALAASEKVLGPEHPETLLVQLNYAVNLVNLKQPKRASQLLERMEPRLLELAALRLRHTRQESVRRLFLSSQSNFQNVVLTLALSQPKSDYFGLAAKVMLRWKQVQGEEEAFLARLVRRRSEKDTEIRELARQIAELRRDFSHLANLPEPDADLQHNKLNELEAKEIRLAQVSREFNRHLQVRSANVDDVRHYLPREGGALLELRQYQPVDFKTATLGEPHWAALLLPAAGEMSLHDLGPVAATWELARTLRKTHARADASALYNNLFGKLDDKLKRYETLYIAPDSFLSLLAFAELVTPDGHYWVQRQTLRQVSVGRHLIPREDRTSNKLKGLLALGEVDYERFSSAEPIAPQDKPAPPDQQGSIVMRALRQGIGQFRPLRETGNEVTEVENRYWNDSNIPPQVWRGVNASEPRLKALATSPSVLHLATHGFYLSDNEKLIENTVNRPMVLSGLALAGANQGLRGKAGPEGEDGILYALEVQDLNLEDAELVTLSACDTGLGTLDYSEGVYGLVRAFHTAGAHDVLMSLWPLVDLSAREFMARFYRTWLDGPKPKDLAVALRETQLSFITDGNESLRNPQVWAPFVLVEGP
jgi:CHAT domain-containing protein/Tfp pilus assembly protein PilF